jgi:hypothetical protein
VELRLRKGFPDFGTRLEVTTDLFTALTYQILDPSAFDQAKSIQYDV